MSTKETGQNPGKRANHAAHAAATWAFIFAGITFYWAAGGTVGASTVGNEIVRLAESHNALFTVVLWADAILKTMLGFLALALVQSWGRAFPRRFLLVSSWVIGLAMAAYGAIQLTVTGVSATLMITGVIGMPPSVDWIGIEGHLAIWDPYWLLGGILFMLTAQPVQNQVRARVAKKFKRSREEAMSRSSQTN